MGSLGDVFKPAVAEIVEEAARALGSGADEEQVGAAVAVIVEETGAGTRADRGGRSLRALERFGNRLSDEADGNRSRGRGGYRAHEFGKGEAALVTKAGSERGAEMLLRDLLEA